ncbi:hypothetical protein PHYPSEUDO_002575 [Phytophthora pseudosyringae]|uniref:Sfi1 spindle body domain-containing protein n=1 Tax=Phytophthora pseudosyringae TaxID=221518 RepID=A0A8T1VX40_9STRA|nr:hypothetical protein PHYPSEUDO_002575 [Phytophthora pseudosyringae]
MTPTRSSRVHHESPSTDPSRRREMVCNLLTQIFVTAQRARASKRRSVPDEETEPLSLIELIQASYSVFERYGIGPPDDAVYHRYLLSLSIDPERDWRKKVWSFDVGSQPRVKRLCTHRHGVAAEEQTNTINSHAVKSDSSVQRRQRKENVVRRASPASSSGFVPKAQRQRDRFGDMLSLDSPIQHTNSNGNALASTGKESNKRVAAGERHLQVLTTSIEQWRATQAVKQLVNPSKAHLSKQQLVTRCAHAVSHWVTVCLPEKIEFPATESPRALPLCILRRISVDVNVLKNYAQRVWRWQMKTLLSAWHRDAQKLKAVRVRNIVKQRAAVLETVFHCIQGWRLFTETAKCSTDRARWITQRCSRTSLRESLGHWRRVFQSRQRLHHVDRLRSRHVKRKVLMSWRAAAEATRDERRGHEMALKRRLFSRWKSEKERQQATRALLCVSSEQRRLRLLGLSWMRLRANVSRHQTARTRWSLWDAATRERRRARAFRRWKVASAQRRVCRERHERFRRYARRRRLARTLAAWAAWTETHVTVAKVLADATDARAAKRTSRCFAGWKEHFEEASQAEEALVASVRHLRRKCVWHHWRKSARARSATRCLASAYSFHLSAKVFTLWKQHATKNAEFHFALLDWHQLHRRNVLALHWQKLVANVHAKHGKQLAIGNFTARKLVEREKIYFSAWQTLVREKQACRFRGGQLQRRRCLVNSAWTQWRLAFWLRTVARLVDGQLHSHRKTRFFRLWKQFVHGARQRHDRASKIVEMLRTFHLNACFRQWKELLTAKHELAKKIDETRHLARRGMLTMRWKAWRRALGMKRGQLKRLSVVTSKWQNRQLDASFHSWKTIWFLRKRHRHLLGTCLLTSKQRQLETHFNTWRRTSRASVARELQIVETQEKMLRFKVKRAIRRWNARRLQQHRRTLLLVNSLSLWRQTLLSRAFQCVRRHTQRRKLKKSQNQNARSRHRSQSTQRVFAAWSAWSRGREQTMKQLEAATYRLDARKLLRSIRRLQHNARSKKRLRTAHVCVVAMSSGHAKIAAFSCWQAFLAKKHSNGRENAARTVAMKNFRVRRSIRQWRRHVQVRKLLKLTLTRAVTASMASLLLRHFANWKTFVTHRALKQKAAAFRYLCVLPLYFGAWRTFLAGKQHKRELLLRARGLWCNQSESRAFNAWVQFAVRNQHAKCALAKWTNRTTARSFASWQRFGSLQKKKARDQLRAVNFYERRMCRRVLDGWRSTSRIDRLTRTCARMWYENTSRKAFGTWTRHARLLQSSRKFLVKMRGETLARVFTAWRERIEQKTRRLEGVQERFALLWTTDARRRTFAHWKRYAQLRSLVRKKLGTQRQCLIRDVVKHWRRVAASRQRRGRCAVLVADRVAFALLRRIWSNWHANARVLRCVKALQGKSTENRVSTDLRQRIRRWKRLTLLSIAVKGFERRHEVQLKRLVFLDGFQRFVALKRKAREVAKRIGSVHETYLKAWLARKLQQRMSIIAACEDIRRSGSSKRLLAAVWAAWMNFHDKNQAQQAAIRQLRVQVSRLEDRQGPLLGRAALVRVLRRWRTLQLARVLERWHDVAQDQKQARVHTLKAIEWWHQAQCGKYFQGWGRFCRQQRKQRRVRAMNGMAKLKRTWALWQVFKAASLSKKLLHRDVRQFHAVRVYRSSLKTWREAATCLRARRAQILELYHSSRVRLLAALLEEWRKFAAMERTKRMQKTVARLVSEQKLLRRSFTAWTANVAGICYHRRQLQLNTERLQVLLLCSSFRAWHAWGKQHKKLKQIVLVLASKSASQVFRAWHAHAERAAGLRHATSSFVRFRGMIKGVRALRSFAQEQANMRRIREKAQRFRSALSGSQVSMHFTRWRTFAALSRQTRAVTLRYLQNKLLPAAWSAWVAFSKVKRELNEKTRSADRHYCRRRLRKTLACWRASSEEKQHFRAVCGTLLMRWRMQTAYRCFCALRGHGVYRKTLRTGENLVRSRVRATAMLKAWYAWRKLLFIARSGKRRMLQRYWTAWVRTRASRRVLQGFQEQIQAQVLRSAQRRCMASWTQFVASHKIEKAMALMSSAFAGAQLQKRVWLCWVKYVARTRAVKLRMGTALLHMHLQLQFKAFRALRAYTLLQKWKTHANVRMLAFRSQRRRARSFFRWRAFVVEQINRRRQLARYVNVMQHSVQQKSFGAWCSFASRRKLLRSKVAQSLAMRTHLCSRLVFQTWGGFVAKVHRNRLARGFLAAKSAARALKRWKQSVVLCKIERMVGTNAFRLVEASFLSWRKAVAATHRIRAFRAKSARRNWLELLGMAFSAWKQRSETHAHCRRLLASVAVGNHLRFRFMLWQRFAAHRKRLANLLVVVADLPVSLPAATQTLDKSGRTSATENGSGELESEESSNSQLIARGDCQEELISAACGERELVSLGQALATKARRLQRFEVAWDVPQAWHRWRQLFHAQLFYRLRRLQLHWMCWQRLVHQQRRTRFIVIKLTRQRQAAAAQTVFRAWAELVARVKQLQKDRLREREVWVLVNTEMARRERRQLKKHWHAWKFHVEEARHLAASLQAYHRAHVLTKFWLVWCHDFRQVTREARRETQRVEAQMRVFRLRRAVRRLTSHQQRSKRARLVLEYFGNRRYDALLPQVLARWRTWSQRQKEVARCLEAARVSKTRRHLTAWKVWQNAQKWQRVVVGSFQSKSVKQRRRDVWTRWRRHVRKQVAKDLALQKAAVFHVCTRLRKRWLRHTQRAIQLREQAETAHGQLCDFRGRRAVGHWRDVSRARRLRRLYRGFVLRKYVQLWQSVVKHAVATRFDAFLLRAKAKKMLVGWQQLAAKHRHWRRLCASFVGNKETETARRVFLRWQQLVNARQGERLAAMHAEQSVLRKGWRRWDRATMASQLRRHEQIEQAAEHEARTLLRQSLGVWRAAVRKQRERRFVLLSCVVKLESVAGQRVLEVVFRAWKRVIDARRRCGAALLRRDRGAAQRALFSWSVWTRERQRRRQALESAATYHAQRLKSAVFFYWQTYALAWQDAAKPIARRHGRLMAAPARIPAEPRDREDSDDSDADVRRPTSPVVKRLRQMKTHRTKTAEDVGEESGTVTLPDAVEISMDVKKRLLLLGKWKPQQNNAKSMLLSTST